ncbi:MAG: nucleotidyltransferase domain-containing protein [Candidatus Hydrogenedentes bacterium]|nr:nucleotidyltransferase domain-containing protein [Candidatus Hydrogenedentota bacterium]MBI3117545.1 nucleotidyltransferase domain-containing protein [Candidatus Hydrogenedentota bacterium]
MVGSEVRRVVVDYLRSVRELGINTRRGVVFGSQSRGTSHEWSDIDLVVIAPELEPPRRRSVISQLWELRASTDSRIEPIACGEKEWESPQGRPILEVAREEGEEILL